MRPPSGTATLALNTLASGRWVLVGGGAGPRSGDGGGAAAAKAVDALALYLSWRPCMHKEICSLLHTGTDTSAWGRGSGSVGESRWGNKDRWSAGTWVGGGGAVCRVCAPLEVNVGAVPRVRMVHDDMNKSWTELPGACFG